ncbi:glycosyltransferase [Pseudarthrobacter sulfonivorans]|uniref:glycosyltransferase n=1 Tax=Pseudarthrobacter sulfonivorans TaxID=121292 RepID=UPI0028593EFF|nr:glycosyltransferase [Pseudarthrobacter sulfonivorans]MDR6413836.1 galactofuranosylgalactofuranosylrhamnosyl-N-acetylglucosaminyl-diphospho-decaprenol beta-1,5/1,6-galactofuranosyltransferase [Pseudarthrobacter sulfonivorans]
MSVATEFRQESEPGTGETTWRTVHRVVFPVDGDTDTLPLYVDFDAARRVVEEDTTSKRGSKTPQLVVQSSQIRSDFILDRRRLSLPAHQRVSFGTYFNAFPASYWRAHTDVQKVRLSIEVDAEATVIVYKSSPRGSSNRVQSMHTSGSTTATCELPLTTFADGGWYWFDLVAHGRDVTLKSADWSVPQPDGFKPGTLSIAVTTFNRPDYCVKHLRNFAGSEDLLGVMDRLIVTDQGNQKVRDEPGFDDAAANLGEKFTLVEQGNLGGSGGFARGMLEAVEGGESDYVMLLDDDVVVETEGVLRAVNFADFTRHPTIVGGHMFNLFERSVIHNFGEGINQYRFQYEALGQERSAHDFAASNLRTTPWMHRRVDVDYNGWWMCLIPTSIIREIGLALPVFIKWDDVEYGIRAGANGYTTVSLPGAAVWHMPWTEKDDTIDWQAYFHQRNRWVAALLYSQYRKGGRLPIESFLKDVRHLLSLQYSAVELRNRALKDLLDGPSHLHETIGSKLAEIRAIRSSFPDAQVTNDLTQFPAVKRQHIPKFGLAPSRPKNYAQAVSSAFSGALRQLRPVSPAAKENPEAVVAAADARWWRLAHLDSALVSASDGTGASWYRRDNVRFRKQLLTSVILHARALGRWDELSSSYRKELPNFTSPEAWGKTFEAASVADEQKPSR